MRSQQVVSALVVIFLCLSPLTGCWSQQVLSALSPFGLAFNPDDRSIFFAARDQNLVLQLSENAIGGLTSWQWTSPWSGLQLSQPLGLTIAILGGQPNLFIADTSASTVVRISLNSNLYQTYVAPLNTLPFAQPQGVAVDSMHYTLFVADTSNSRIAALDLVTGAFYQLPDPLMASYRLSAPTALVLDTSGYLYVVDSQLNQVLKIDTYNNLNCTSNPTVGFRRPSSVVLDSEQQYAFVVDTNNHRIVQLTVSDLAFVMSWGDSESLFYPYGIAVDFSGNLLVSDADRARVLRLDVTTHPTAWTISDNIFTAADALSGPSGIAIDSSGGIWVADTNNNRTVLLDTQGAVQQVLLTSSVSASSPVGLAFNNEGELLVVDAVKSSGYYQIIRFNTQTLSSDNSFYLSQLSAPRGLAINVDGWMYVANTGASSIAVLDPSGSYAGSLGAQMLSSPYGVAVSDSGVLYIADTGNDRIVVMAANNTVLALMKTTGPPLSAPQGVAVDWLGNIWIADTGNGRVVKLSSAGVQLTVFNASSDPPMRLPCSIAFDLTGALLVTDQGNNRLLRFPGVVPADSSSPTPEPDDNLPLIIGTSCLGGIVFISIVWALLYFLLFVRGTPKRKGDVECVPTHLPPLRTEEKVASSSSAASSTSFPSRPSSRSGYAVGIVTALHLERVAMEVCLDERWDRPYLVIQGDVNVYTYGRIGVHPVVIISLTGDVYGQAAATSVTERLLLAHSGIREVLMVGIGGGVPHPVKHDVRLGDVVISAGPVWQYDYGKLMNDGTIVTTGQLPPPSPRFQALLGSLITRDEIEKVASDPLKELTQQLPSKLAHRDKQTEYSRPPADTDILYDGDHETHQAVEREARADSAQPHIHCGIIATANVVLKNSKKRDSLRDYRIHGDVLCVDMEAAGVAHATHAHGVGHLVIRGICDYADSHKHNMWQGHAAVVAAATTKILLQHLPGLAHPDHSQRTTQLQNQ